MMLVSDFDQSNGPRADITVVRGPRVVRDAVGDVTTIVERRAEGVAGARSSRCLVISNERGFVRLWDYPADWSTLPDRVLVALGDRPRRAQSA